MQIPPTPTIVESLQESVGPAFLIGAFVPLLGGYFGGRLRSLGVVLAFAMALLVGNYLTKVWPGWWPSERRIAWVAWSAIVGGFAGVLIRSPSTRILGHSLWAAAVATMAIRVIPGPSLIEPMGLVPAFVGLTAIVAYGSARLSELRPGALVPLVLAMSLGAAGAVVIHAHSKSVMDIAVIGSMAFFGFAAVAFFTRWDYGAAMPGAAILLAGVLFAGYHETESLVPKVAFLLPALAPVVALVGLIPALETRGRLSRNAVVLVPVMIVLLTAIAIAARHESLSFEPDE